MSNSSDDGYLSLAYPLGEGAGVRLFSITYSNGLSRRASPVLVILSV